MRSLILDYGHGGIIDGVYQTPGGKQYHFIEEDPIVSIYEGVTNRQTAAGLANLALEAGVPVWDCVGDRRISEPVIWTELVQADVPLSLRVRSANKHPCGLLVSCHSNAVGNNIRGPSLPAQGIEVYTSRGTTRSDAVAESLAESFRVNLAELRWRRVAEANFYILRRSTMPAVLGEVGFFTNLGDASFLLQPANHARISAAYWKGVSTWFS